MTAASSNQRINEMKTLARQMGDAELADAFRALASAPNLPDPERLTKSVLQEELERRNPAITNATNAWVDDFTNADTQDDVVLRFL